MIDKSSVFRSKITDGDSRQNFVAIFDDLYLSGNDGEISVTGVRITDNFVTSEDLHFGDTPSNTMALEVLDTKRTLRKYKWGPCSTFIGVLTEEAEYDRPDGVNAHIILGSDTWTAGPFGVKYGNTSLYAEKEVYSLVSDSKYIYAVGDGICIRISPKSRSYISYNINRHMYNKLIVPHSILWDGTESAETCKVWTDHGTVETWEYCATGVFNVDSPSQIKSIRINLPIAYDNMIFFDENADDWVHSLKYPLTLGSMFKKLCKEVGITAETDTFTNDDIEFPEDPFDPEDSYTYRDILGYIAERANCNAHIDRYGRMTLKWIAKKANVSIPLGRIGYSDMYQADYSVGRPTRITVKADDGKTFSKGHGRNEYLITGNPLIQKLYLSNRKAINRLPVYTPATFTALEGDPSIEAGDMAMYTIYTDDQYAYTSEKEAGFLSRNGYQYIVENEYTTMPVMCQEIVWRGYTNVTYISEGNITRAKETTASKAIRSAKASRMQAKKETAKVSTEIQKTAQTAKNELVEAVSTIKREMIANKADVERMMTNQRTETAEAIESATVMLTGANRGYKVETFNEEGYPDGDLIMDSADQATAQNVWRRNVNGFGHSSTGVDGPYTTAITQDGSIVADFVKTGKLMDQSGNYELDMDTGTVVMKSARIYGGFIDIETDASTNDKIQLWYNNGNTNKMIGCFRAGSISFTNDITGSNMFMTASMLALEKNGLGRVAQYNEDVKISGKLYPLGITTSALGDYKISTNMSANLSVQPTTWTETVQITLTKGNWLIYAVSRWQNNANGFRAMNIKATSGESGSDMSVNATNGTVTKLQCMKIIEVTENSKVYYMNCYHNHTSAINVLAAETVINAIRIGGKI